MRVVSRSLGCLAVGIALTCGATGCRHDDEPAPAARQRVINEAKGAYRGVPLGSRTEAVHAAFGPKKSTGHEEGAPLEGETEGAWSLSYPEPLCEDPPPVYRYERVAFGFVCNKLIWIVTNEPGAETSRGVAIGDPLADAAAAYPEAVCGTAGGGEWAEYHACSAKLKPRRFIWFGGDPITTIELASVPLEGVSQDLAFGGRVFTLADGDFVTYPPGKLKVGDRIVCVVDGKRVEGPVPRRNMGYSSDPMRVSTKPDGRVRVECGGIHAETAPPGSF